QVADFQIGRVSIQMGVVVRPHSATRDEDRLSAQFGLADTDNHSIGGRQHGRTATRKDVLPFVLPSSRSRSTPRVTYSARGNSLHGKKDRWLSRLKMQETGAIRHGSLIAHPGDQNGRRQEEQKYLVRLH